MLVFSIKKVSASFNLMEAERICSVHINEVEGGQLQAGDNVEYEVTDGRKGPQASSVKVV